ncbi:MAG: hypothetical protein ACXWUN_06895 [Allosphingosinicella sp.]
MRLGRFLLLSAGLLGAASAEAQSVRFIACPVYRDADAGRKSGCWLADESASGVRYDVSRSPTLPDWNFEILVEGEPAAVQNNVCGGVVLEPVRVSVLPGHCTRHMLPAEGFPGRRFVLPPRNVRPMSEVRPPFAGTRETKTFHIMFDFNRAFMVYQLSDFLFDQAISYIRAVDPARIVVTGFAATDPATVSGREIAEDPAIAEARATLIRESLLRMGVPAERIELRHRTDPAVSNAEGADGLAEPSRRRVDILVEVTPRD